MTFTRSGVSAAETNVLQWTINNNEAYIAAKNKTVATKQVIVAWAPKDGTKSRGTIYATLQWTIGKRNIEPKASINDKQDKTYALWSDGYGYAKAGVNDDCEFKVTTTSSFNQDPKDIVYNRLEAIYRSLLNGMDYKFTSAEADGYNLVVSPDGKSVKCNGNLIVSIGNDGKTLTYAENDLAKQILNPADPEVKEPLTVNIKMIPLSCEPAQGVIQLEGDVYAMKYIRPMTVNVKDVESIVDRADKELTSEVKLTFKNWLGEKVNYSKYGVTGAAQNGIAKSNFKKGDVFEALPEGFEIKYNGEGFDPANGEYGVITYKRPSTLVVAKDFQVRVPILVNYKWGQIHVTLELKVKKTEK